MAVSAGLSGLAGLAFIPEGYDKAEAQDQQTQLNKLKLQQAKYADEGAAWFQEAFGGLSGLASLGGQGGSPPQPPPPGQPSQPPQAPSNLPGLWSGGANPQGTAMMPALPGPQRPPGPAYLGAPPMGTPQQGFTPGAVNASVPPTNRFAAGGPPLPSQPQGQMQPAQQQAPLDPRFNGRMPPGVPQPQQLDLPTVINLLKQAAAKDPAKYKDPQAMIFALNQFMPWLQLQDKVQLQQMNQQFQQLRLGMEAQRLQQGQERINAQQGKTQAGLLGQDALHDLVDQYISGNKSVTQFFGFGAVRAQNAANFSSILAEEMQKRGMSGADINKAQTQFAGETSYQRTAGTQAARVESASNEVDQLAPQALETSANLPRGSWVPINKLLQSYEAGTSDPAYNDFALANFALLNAYTRAMNPTGQPRVNDRLEAHAAGILSTATDQKSYEVQVKRLLKEIAASKKAVAETRAGQKDQSQVPQQQGWSAEKVQ